MTQSTQREKDTENGTNRHGGKRRARGWVVGAALVALGAAGGALTTIAVDTVAHDGWHSGLRMHERGYAKSPERAIARVQRVSAWALGSVDATDEQRERIDTILAAAANDLLPIRDQHHAHHHDLIAELSRPQVDRAGLERIRSAEIALVEKASARLVDATVAIAEVLDPEQRQQLLAKLENHRH
jgi:Spy/CpxP family protein refolding chaperone